MKEKRKGDMKYPSSIYAPLYEINSALLYWFMKSCALYEIL